MVADSRPDIDAMGHREFEYFVADLWRRQGYDAHPTQQSGDGGADVIADDGSERLAIEAKWRSRGTISPATVRQIGGVATREGFDRGVVVTNQDFSDAAYREANQMDVKLINGDQLRELDQRNRRETSKVTSQKDEDMGVPGLVLWSLVAAALYIVEDPQRLVNIIVALLLIVVGYIVLDGVLQVVGIDLPGGA